MCCAKWVLSDYWLLVEGFEDVFERQLGVGDGGVGGAVVDVE